MRGAVLPSRQATTRVELDYEEHRELVRRILASSTFVKSERLSRLLQYICEETFEGRAEEINEQRVGEAVFGRPRDYDSTVDGIVRTQASRLRQRLELYFSGEGSNEPVRVTVPRGSYVPVFDPKQPPEPPQMYLNPPVSPPLAPQGRASSEEPPRTSRGLPWILVVVLASALCILLVRDRTNEKPARQVTSPGHALWSQIFQPGQTTLLVPGDSSLVIYEGLRGHDIGLAEYVSGNYRNADNLPTSTPEQLAAHLANARYTSIVDLEVARTLALISRSQMGALEVRYPREVRPNDLKQGNLIFVGAAEANPWVYLFEENMNFVFSNDRVHRVFSVLNRKPQQNEPHQWDSANADKEHRVYAVVAYLPNLSGNGNVLILEGTSMAGTECAWDFVSDDSKLMPFLHSIHPVGARPPYFELVLGTNNISGSAVESLILAYRIR
jgi:hypothetical protein